MQKERIMIFIDGSNLYYSLKNLNINKIDFEKLLGLLTKNNLLISTFYYNAPLNIKINQKTYWEQQKFFNELKKIPDFNLVLCKLRKHKRQNGNFAFDVKGDNVHLAVDLVSSAYENLYDTAIIVSGDEDFVPAIKKVRKLGKKVINAYFKSTSSTTLKKACNEHIYMNNLIKENKNCLVLP
ncbi:MAG: NYN domain-containing protein [Bacteroidales bacterium]|nr:NYN domain-containing protein [Bacteroidales bacterium]